MLCKTVWKIPGKLLGFPQNEKEKCIKQWIMSNQFSSRAAQRMVSAANGTKTSRSHGNGSERGGFCGALQRAPPLMPPSLARRLSNKESLGFGRVSWEFSIVLILISKSTSRISSVWNFKNFPLTLKRRGNENFMRKLKNSRRKIYSNHFVMKQLIDTDMNYLNLVEFFVIRTRENFMEIVISFP